LRIVGIQWGCSIAALAKNIKDLISGNLKSRRFCNLPFVSSVGGGASIKHPGAEPLDKDKAEYYNLWYQHQSPSSSALSLIPSIIPVDIEVHSALEKRA